MQNVGINNLKEVFIGYPHMFTKDPDKFKAIFVKYDQADLIRCIEKSGGYRKIITLKESYFFCQFFVYLM